VNIRIGATDKTATAFRSAETRMKTLAGQAKSMAGMLGMGIGVAAFARLAKSAIDYGSAITDAAAATRLGIEEYQILKFAAQEAGAGMDKVTTASAKIQKATNDAINGLTTYTRAFDALGINVEEFQRLSPDQQFTELGRAMVNSKDQAVAYASVLDIIGSRNAPRLMEVLQKLGTDGWDKVAESARTAGQVMSEETAQNMDSAADALERAGTRITSAAATAMSKWMELNEVIGEVLYKMTDFSPQVTVSGPEDGSLPIPSLTPKDIARITESSAIEAGELGVDPKIIERATEAQQELSAAVDETTAALAEQSEIMGQGAVQAIEVQESALENWLNKNTTYQDLVMHSMQDMSTQMTSSFSSFCKDGELDFGNFAASVMQNIADMIFQMTVAIPIAKALASSLVGSDGSGGIIGSFVGGLVSGGGTSGAKAAGGPVYAGRSYLVGEKGPEIMTTRSNGTVIPNEAVGRKTRPINCIRKTQ